MKKFKIGFIGCGNIASAIIRGATASGYIKYENLFLFDTDASKTDPFCKSGATYCASSLELVSRCDFVFLTIKPQIYDIVLSEISSNALGTCFVSVAAGISIQYVKQLLGNDVSVIRAMPNTPLSCGKGATALVHTYPVSDEEFAFVKDLFACSGACVKVSESLINTVTAVSGSAPAYILRFAKDLISFGIENGLSNEDASSLVLSTLLGTADMALTSEKDIDTLIKNVTSPNGTTYAGLCSMNDTDFDGSIKACLKATVMRAEELSK